MNDWCFSWTGMLESTHESALRCRTGPTRGTRLAAQRLSSTRRRSEPDPAGCVRHEFNVSGGWLQSLTYVLADGCAHQIAAMVSLPMRRRLGAFIGRYDRHSRQPRLERRY